MKNRILISTLTLLLFSCNSRTEGVVPKLKVVDSSTVSLTNIESERFLQETDGSKKFDTILVDKQLHVTIIRTELDSYVEHEYVENGKKQIAKYRDAEIALTIEKGSQTLLDTVFRKEHFLEFGDQAFMDIAIFHNYWFDRLDNDRIEFFGVIGVPETDWTIDFHHYFDLSSKTLTFEQNINAADY